MLLLLQRCCYYSYNREHSCKSLFRTYNAYLLFISLQSVMSSPLKYTFTIGVYSYDYCPMVPKVKHLDLLFHCYGIINYSPLS